MRKSFLFVLLVSYLLLGCKNSSSQEPNFGINNPGDNKPATIKHIEPGTNLIFTCVDSFNETTVVLASLWNISDSSWSILLSEYDKQGNKINEQNSLIGNPDAIQEWQMNVKNGSQNFAKISQAGEDQAIFFGASRNMDCTFK